MFSTWMTKVFGSSWKTTLAGALTFLTTVPSVVTAFHQWQAHQPIDWHSTVTGLIISLGLIAAKDFNVHSTADQVQQSTMHATLDTPKQ